MWFVSAYHNDAQNPHIPCLCRRCRHIHANRRVYMIASTGLTKHHDPRYVYCLLCTVPLSQTPLRGRDVICSFAAEWQCSVIALASKQCGTAIFSRLSTPSLKGAQKERDRRLVDGIFALFISSLFPRLFHCPILFLIGESSLRARARCAALWERAIRRGFRAGGKKTSQLHAQKSIDGKGPFPLSHASSRNDVYFGLRKSTLHSVSGSMSTVHPPRCSKRANSCRFYRSFLAGLSQAACGVLLSSDISPSARSTVGIAIRFCYSWLYGSTVSAVVLLLCLCPSASPFLHQRARHTLGSVEDTPSLHTLLGLAASVYWK